MIDSIAGAVRRHPLRYWLGLGIFAIAAVGVLAVIDIRQSAEAEARLRTEIDALLVEALGGGTTAFTTKQERISAFQPAT